MIAAGNVVSGNGGEPDWGFGIEIDTADANFVIGNRVGTDPTGTFAIGNVRAGIILYAASSNVLGGSTPGERNVSSGNNSNGVTLITSSNNNQVLGNYIGLDVTGTMAIPNASDGVEIEDATGNIIGPGNVISGNSRMGVFLESSAL